MKVSHPPVSIHFDRNRRLSKRPNSPKGMTLLELTVVIIVLLTLITVLFFGARAWKRGSDRTLCILNIEAVQKAVRGYSNMHAIDQGASVPGLQGQIIGIGRFLENTPICPAGGNYSFGTTHGGDVIPPMGTVYMDCSLSTTDDHVPQNTAEW
jgi:type II secretory pathway pseudopilin PulG